MECYQWTVCYAVRGRLGKKRGKKRAGREDHRGGLGEVAIGGCRETYLGFIGELPMRPSLK